MGVESLGRVDEGEERCEPEEPGVIAAQVDGGELLGELGAELLEPAGQGRIARRALELVQRVHGAGARSEERLDPLPRPDVDVAERGQGSEVVERGAQSGVAGRVGCVADQRENERPALGRAGRDDERLEEPPELLSQSGSHRRRRDIEAAASPSRARS